MADRKRAKARARHAARNNSFAVPEPALPPVDRAGSWLTWIIAISAMIIPLILSASGEDTFRYPKELALRFETILLIVVLVLLWAFKRLRLQFDIRQKWMAVTAAICCWTVFTALLSTNRLVSIPPTVRVLEYALVLTVTVLVLRHRPLWIAGVIVPSAIVNAIIYILQEFDVWSPFATTEAIEKHITRTALIGNPNDVGSYLIVPALIAVVLALVSPRGRIAWAAAATVLIAGTFVTQTVAAIAGLFVALLVLLVLWLRSPVKAFAVIMLTLVAAVTVTMTYAPLRQRLTTMREALAKRDYEALSAARLVPFFAAAEMARDHPLVGVGPGCFSYNFFDYKLRVQIRHRELFGRGVTTYNFGEVHNDHLQVASETGLPGYVLFLASLVILAAGSFRSGRSGNGPGDHLRGEFVRLLSLPLAISLFVLALAQFPLELVAPTHAYLWAAGIVMSWRQP
ncbi:MAG TPA: O-antigen ligase family protein [Thermoanaerobaculia bacterium]|jgi:O-antigen ligase|nr:O-antigen ligase family protein [Thermoanaerobaculia bacterium]